MSANAMIKRASLLSAVLLSGCATMSPSDEDTISYQCGAGEVTVQVQQDSIILTRDAEQAVLPIAKSASGARYSDEKDQKTEYWNKGNEAYVIWKGQKLPLCVEEGTLPRHFTAQGNEPFWQVSVNPQHMTLSTPDSEAIIDIEQLERVSEQPNEWQIDSTTEKHLRVIEQACRDSMSGRLYPYQVDLSDSERTYSGCGGDSEWLLQGVVWTLTDFEGEPIQSKAPTLQFLADNQLAGFNGCNRFFGQYNMGGELAQLRVTGSTKMACAGAADTLSRKFNAFLQRAYQVNMSPEGRLILTTRGGRQLVFTK